MSEIWVLTNEESKPVRRIEIYLLPLEKDNLYTLISYSGVSGALPSHYKGQGPLPGKANATFVQRSVVKELRRQGFKTSDNSMPIWHLQARRELRTIIASRKAAYSKEYD